MKVLDLDMDYFMDCVATNIDESIDERLSEDEFGDCIWSEQRIRCFLENNLGLSKVNKVKGRIVSGHNESLFAWKEWIQKGDLVAPFEVIHVDSHADLGLGYSSWKYILDTLLTFPIEMRPLYTKYEGCLGRIKDVGIGDYLLYAIAFRWISSLTYCTNPKGDKNDYLWDIIKDYDDKLIWKDPVCNCIQLVSNPEMDFPEYYSPDEYKEEYLNNSIKEPEVPFIIIPTMEDVKYDGDFTYAILAQSPNYTPASADFILEIFKEYIEIS